MRLLLDHANDNSRKRAQSVCYRLCVCGCCLCLQVFRDTVTWSAGASGSQAFWLALQSSPSSGQLLVQLQQPQGAVLDRDAMSTVVEVQSPIIGFKTDLVRAAAYAIASLAGLRTRTGACKTCAV
jgi:hypothetical protein